MAGDHNDVITGLIPISVGQADNEHSDLGFGDGGFDTPPNTCE